MTELDKILEWVNRHTTEEYEDAKILVEDLINFINELKNPPKKMVWQCKTQSNPEWRNITDEEYEIFQHLSRFDFQRVEV